MSKSKQIVVAVVLSLLIWMPSYGKSGEPRPFRTNVRSDFVDVEGLSCADSSTLELAETKGDRYDLQMLAVKDSLNTAVLLNFGVDPSEVRYRKDYTEMTGCYPGAICSTAYLLVIDDTTLIGGNDRTFFLYSYYPIGRTEVYCEGRVYRVPSWNAVAEPYIYLGSGRKIERKNR